jgi:hypothetical protein
VSDTIRGFDGHSALEDFESNPAGFERLAKQLIFREFPGVVCIDGRGGDDGIDARWNGTHRHDRT